jgi:hypothetical protein
LRHDVDPHLAGVDAIARVESRHGVRATYYVPVTQPFNPAHGANRAVIESLVAQGHEIGLHYDLTTYPAGPAAMADRLQLEVAWLSAIAGCPVETISTHEPHRELPDPFLASADLLHPHSPELAEGLVYVSDSCRAWRDDSLLRCFGESPPDRVLLNTHPELWLGPARVPASEYVASHVIPNALEPQRAWYHEVVGAAWDRRSGLP